LRPDAGFWLFKQTCSCHYSLTLMIDLTTGAVIFCVATGLFFLVLWLCYDRRDHRLFERERRKTAFHCIRCDHIWAEKSGVEECKCPKCGHTNVRLRY